MKRALERLGSKIQGALTLVKASVALASGHLAHERVFGHLNDDVWFAVNTTAYRRYRLLRRVLPSLPDAQTQIGFIGSADDNALREAFLFYQLVRALSARAGQPVTRTSRVLDFGCGWGRTIRFFLRDAPAAQLYGVDVLQLAVDLCRQTDPWCQFSLVPPLPPSALPSERFDVIYLYSVFSHLSEETHDRWLTEFHRLLRPGGLLFATTWPREYIERCERARGGNTAGTHTGSLKAFVGADAWLARYDRGEFCHSPVGGGRSLTKDFYGETCIPETYVHRRWSDRFQILDYLEADNKSLLQDLVVAKRK
jgi:SAM-dependent methyltransferase